MARGAERHLHAERAERSRHEPARLPEGRLLQPAHVRAVAPQVPDAARRRARLRPLAAARAGTRRSAQVADKLLDVALQRRARHASSTTTAPPTSTSAPAPAAEMRFFNLLGATIMDSWAGVGDLPMGAIQTWGHFNADGTSDDWFNADYILIWIANPVYTRIPGRALHVGSALQRRDGRLDRARLQRQLDPRRPVAQPAHGHRRGARAWRWRR